MLQFDDICRRKVTIRFARWVIALFLALSIALSATLPNFWIEGSLHSPLEASVSPSGLVAPVPILNDRHELQPAPSSRENPLTVSPEVIAVAPEIHGAVILTVRDDTPLDSRFVYTQTTSSRL
jgi:hypothetical protein